MAILDDRTIDFLSRNAAQTERLGVRLGELLRPGDIVSLLGEMGSGKTVFARGLGRGWGTATRITSPSYVLVNEYPRLRDGRILYHIDCYRLESAADIATAGLEDILDSGEAAMIEWAERIDPMLPDDRLTITMTFDAPTRRQLRFTAVGDRASAILNTYKKTTFGVQ